jgi:hypothetical protein
MEILSPDNIENFLERICRGGDAVILSVLFLYHPDYIGDRVEVQLQVMDRQAPEPFSWVLLHLVMDAAVYFIWAENNKRSNQVIGANDLHIGWFDGLFYIDFGDAPDGTDTPEKYYRSTALVVGRSVSWEITPYIDGALNDKYIECQSLTPFDKARRPTQG